MHKKFIIAVLFILLGSINSADAVEMYTQSLTIGGDKTEFYDDTRKEDEEDKLIKGSIINSYNQYNYNYNYNYPYDRQVIRYTPLFPVNYYSGGVVPPRPNVPSTGGGMRVYTNSFGHGYNYGGKGIWVNSTVTPSRPAMPPPTPGIKPGGGNNIKK